MATTKERREIIITGFGGQGIILTGRILGSAAVLGDGRQSTLVQSYGPESRGGACCAQVIISDEIIQYPYVRQADALICMSQSGYQKYRTDLKPDGILMTDRDLVKPDTDAAFDVPATRMAEEMGRKMMANILMIGFATAVAGLTTREAARLAVADAVPAGTQDANLAAFDRGYDYGISKLKGRERKSAGRPGAAS